MRAPLVLFISALAASLPFAIACGEKKPASDATSAPGAPSNSSPSAPSSGPASPTSAPTMTTTTTTRLGDNGDLQGTKITTTTTTTPAASSSGSAAHGPHTSEPGRGAADIRAIILARRDQARACYDAALKNHPGIEGDLDIKWTIDPDGNVMDLGVDDSKSTISEPSVASCIELIIKGIQFAPSAKGFETKTHYPFNFHPHSARYHQGTAPGN